ncbi:MAG: ABC transporter ATP-binding protein [Oscillospiraceae bacterium]|nr:ABC transporter ATP-binding protein [Oscillospiraceae bacterium]
MLSLNSVYVGYPGKQVVKNVSFDVFPGEFCALLGLNGSGKTTLLKGICGLLPISDGKCLLGGTDLTELNEKKRAKYTSLIPQRHSKLIGVTVIDAVLMGYNAKLGFLEFPSQTDKGLAANALEKMGILHLANNDFSKLSEGQKQLVILARSIVQDAPVMLMDEPDSALDFPNKHMILSAVRKLVKESAEIEKSCLLTLHDPNLALRFCDRLILLHEGEVVAVVSLADANCEDVQSSLSAVYEGITVYERDGCFRCELR